MLPDIAQAFNYYLEHLRGKPIIQTYIGIGPNLHDDIGRLSELRGKASNRRGQVALTLAGISQPVHVAAQVIDPIAGHLDQPVGVGGRIPDYFKQVVAVAARVYVIRGEFLADTSQTHLQTDVWLDYAVVDVARDSLTFVFRCFRCKSIH